VRTAHKSVAKDPLSDLPPPSRRRAKQALRAHLGDSLDEFRAFCASIESNSDPIWPSRKAVEYFYAQVHCFRLLSKRRSIVKPIQIVRHIDHQCPGLNLVETLQRLVRALERYCGTTPLARRFEDRLAEKLSASPRKNSAPKTQPRHPNETEDLPACFRKINQLVSHPGLQLRVGPRNLVEILQTNIEAAITEFDQLRNTLFWTRLRAVTYLRKFIFELGDEKMQRRLFGLSLEQQKEWGRLHDKATIRNYQARWRARNRTK